MNVSLRRFEPACHSAIIFKLTVRSDTMNNYVAYV